MDTQDKKKDILKAASMCFARYGYEKTTLDDIGKLVGLNKASLYYYFKNKEGIYTEVIHSEANEFLICLFEKVDKVQGCKGKILTYLTERLKYIRDAINLNQLTVDSIQKLTPFFGEMYSKVVEKEITYLSGVLEFCMKKEEIIACEASRVAKNIITVTEAIKNRLDNCNDCSSTPENRHIEAESEILFTVSLMLDGLNKK
jgi:AcrR family transcriptional regulator